LYDNPCCGWGFSPFGGSAVRADHGRGASISSGADVAAIAEAYADGYRQDFRQPVFSGCLAGLKQP
jgi:hypothetical protein